MATPVPGLSFSHLGIFVADLAVMEDFYTRVLGFTVTDRGDLDTRRGAVALVFLSRDPRDHHQIVLAGGRPRELPFNPINQISFRMDDLAGLRQMHARLEAEAVADIAPVSHGNALSVYFLDPEGNRVELFIDTPWYVDQPLRIPLDMGLPDATLWAKVEAEARILPGFMPVEQWRA
ncbi:MAG: glyoxalase, partial [Betaproteobacteria bacterium]|nr:glyoxalase [Betaproteobacteria bacterium]